MKKYELIPEGKLFRIIALKDFNGVRKGYFGGVVENRNNLGQQGDCWIHENAKVTGNALVSGDARVTGNAEIYENAKVYGNALVTGNAEVSGNAKVYGNAQIIDNSKVTGNAKATKEVITFGNIFDYDITITDNHIKIGCQQYLKSRWLEFTNKEILEMGGKRALKFWGLFKPFAINRGFFN